MSGPDAQNNVGETFSWDPRNFPDELIIATAITGCLDGDLVFPEFARLYLYDDAIHLLTSGRVRVRNKFVEILRSKSIPLLGQYSFDPASVRADGTPISRVPGDPDADALRERMEGYAKRLLTLLQASFPLEAPVAQITPASRD